MTKQTIDGPVELGDRVKDPITGFQGIAHAVTVWLNGCVRIAIQPEKLNKDGKVQEDQYFDTGQLVILTKRAFSPPPLICFPKLDPLPIGGPERETSNHRPPRRPPVR